MIFPKAVREEIIKSQGKVMTIPWPKGKEPRLNHFYTVQSSGKAGGHSIRVLAKDEQTDGSFTAEVKLDDDRVRLLGKNGGFAESPAFALPIDPTNSGFEPEGVSEAELLEQAKDAKERFRQSRLAFLASRENEKLPKRLHDVLAEAGRQRVNVSPKVRVIERQIQSLEEELYARRAAA